MDGSDIWQRDEVDSPCVSICVIHQRTGLCTGCLRTLAEIADWSAMTPEARAGITAELPLRRAELRKRRGGRKARVG